MSVGRIKVGEKIRDFTLQDTEGKSVTLSDFEGKENIFLVFNRGFAWPFCRGHMAQLRQDYDVFVDRNTEVIAVGPDSTKAFQDFWEEKEIPFIGLADPDHRVAKMYDQEVNLFKFGRMPAQMIIDKEGIVRYVHYSNSMSDLPENEEILEILDSLED